LGYLFRIFIIILLTCSTSFAQSASEVIFTQEVSTIDKDGNLDTGVSIDPQKMSEVRDYDFDLGAQRVLRITTNIEDPGPRNLGTIAETIRKGYDFIESATGRPLKQGVLLYIIELDEVPVAYSFKDSYEKASQWGEVRLALIKKDAALTGAGAPSALSSLLYDILPHELTHAALRSIPQLSHDTNGSRSYHTRWFIEGVCETLAKEFAKREGSGVYPGLLRLRKPEQVLGSADMFPRLMQWQQENDNSFRLESDLYGAAMLTMMTWTRFISVEEMLNKVQSSHRSLQGSDLVALMEETTGMSSVEIAKEANSYGHSLKESELKNI